MNQSQKAIAYWKQTERADRLSDFSLKHLNEAFKTKSCKGLSSSDSNQTAIDGTADLKTLQGHSLFKRQCNDPLPPWLFPIKYLREGGDLHVDKGLCFGLLHFFISYGVDT